MRHLIVGTAGHINHGKSALVQALTGTDPDRLPEEKARGITIDLGFADLDLGAEKVVSFVDVPGHERFVRHMVAGAAGIDCVLLVIAADDGVRPQTREHLAICALLGVRHGIVALTKADLLDAELRQVAELEVREFLAGTFLDDAPLAVVSSRTGEGLPELRVLLAAAFDRIPPRAAGGVTRLPVDRSFVLHGFGTVVTGTLVSGVLCEGDEVEVLPGGKRGRVRGLQVHHRRVGEVRSGQRAAVNLQGLDRDEVPRGATLSRPGSIPVTRRAWARLRMLPSAAAAFRKGGTLRFHQGTCERTARLRLLGDAAGDEVDAEIVLRQDTVLLPGDAFILRRPAPVATMGGGTIFDVRPPSRRQHSASARTGSGQDARGALLARLERAGAAGRAVSELGSELGWLAEEINALLAALQTEGLVVRAGASVVSAVAWGELKTAALAELQSFHRGEPLRLGMSREELRGRVARLVPQDVWRVFLDSLRGDGDVRLDGERAALAAHQVTLEGRDLEAARKLESVFRDAGLDPPDFLEAAKRESPERGVRLLGVLEAQGRLVKIRDGRYFHADALAGLREKLRVHARSAPTIDVPTFKQIAGVTRKNAIPLLEQLDAERFTRRVGNLREILAR